MWSFVTAAATLFVVSAFGGSPSVGESASPGNVIVAEGKVAMLVEDDFHYPLNLL
jgi:hypothetical protein